jgi:hypothetical protein
VTSDGRQTVCSVRLRPQPGRSQMAAGYLKQLSGGQIEVRSAGSEPASTSSTKCCKALSAGRTPISTASLSGAARSTTTLSCSCVPMTSKRARTTAHRAEDVTLEETLSEPGDVLRYCYDYGDSWGVRIALEFVRPFDESAPLPCVSTAAVPPRRKIVPDCGMRETLHRFSKTPPTSTPTRSTDCWGR